VARNDVVEKGSQGRLDACVRHGRSQAVGQHERDEFIFIQPQAGQFPGIVFIGEAAAVGDIPQREAKPVAHEFDIALGGFAGDAELLGKRPGIGKAVILDAVVKPKDAFVNDFRRHAGSSVENCARFNPDRIGCAV